jgi:small subunit ribosomal protein S16
MVVIRLSRGGSKKRPFYHIVVSDRRDARDGRCIERIGYFNPMARGKDVPLRLDVERVRYWVSKGAQPSERVHGLIKTAEKTTVTTETAQ